MQLSNIEFLAQAIVELGRVECDTIEYKKSDTWKDKILKTACAYANNYMMREIGFIFIGIEEVDDKDGTKAVPKRPIAGVEESKLESTENRLKKLLAEIHPRIDYYLLEIVVDDKVCVVIAVEPGSSGPYATSERAQKTIGLNPGSYIRVGRESRLPNKREEFELMKKFADVHFSSELNRAATIDSLSFGWMSEYLTLTDAAKDIRDLPKLEMAKAMGLVSGDEYGKPRAKNFAVLMFAKKPEDYIPCARLEIIREKKGTDHMQSIVFDGPVWTQVNSAIDYFDNHIRLSYTVREPELTGHRTVWNWPRIAFAELLTNAVLHKDYDKHKTVDVYVYKNKIVIINHNRPLPPVTIESMNEKEDFWERGYINPELKDMFFSLGLIERYGSGIRRAKNAMKDAGNPYLVFEPTNDTDDYTAVILPINEEFARIRDGVADDYELVTVTGKETVKETVGTVKETGKENSETVKETVETSEEAVKETFTTGEETDSKRDRIVRILAREPRLTVKQVADRVGLSPRGVRYHLDILRLEGAVRREGSTKSGVWVVMNKGDGNTEG